MTAPNDQAETIAAETFFDLNDGRIVTRGAPGWLHDVVADVMSKVVREPAEQLAGQLLRLLDADDHRAAASLVVKSFETGLDGPPHAPLLAQLRRIKVDSLPDREVAAFRRARSLLAAVADDYETAGTDAEALLASPDVTTNDRTWLRLTVATAALKRGAVESSFAAFREIAESGESDARSRAWAYRNMSVIVPLKDERCEQYSRRSSDFFLMDGDKRQAAASLIRAMRSRLSHRPMGAAEVLNDPIEWFAGDGVQDQYLRGGILQNRARAAWLLKNYAQAFNDAVASANVLRGLAGAENDLAMSLLIAVDSGARIGAPAEVLVKEHDDLMKANHGEEHALRHRLIAQLQTFDIHAIKQAQASEDVQRRPTLRAIVGMAEAQSNTLSHVERLQVLETALSDAGGGGDEGIESAVIQAIGDELLKAGNLEGALVRYREVLQREPLNLEARQNYAFILQKLNRDEEGIRFVEDQQKLWGERPAMTFTLARFLLSAGQVDRATNLFARLAVAPNTPEAIRSVASTWRDKALAAGGRILTEPPPVAAFYSRANLESELKRFAEMIKRSKRMTFWRKGDNSKHRWIERPEAHAKHLLFSFLDGAFRTGLKQFEEIGSGAGRIDLYLELAGGLSAIIELKMLGAPYSSTYALQGEDQITHYMDNRDCHLGYLMVFDARVLTWGQLPGEPVGSNSVVRIFVDVRPDIPSKPKKSGPKPKKNKKTKKATR